MRQTGVVGEVVCPVLVGRRPEIQALESARALAAYPPDPHACGVLPGQPGHGLAVPQVAAVEEAAAAVQPASVSTPARAVAMAKRVFFMHKTLWSCRSRRQRATTHLQLGDSTHPGARPRPALAHGARNSVCQAPAQATRSDPQWAAVTA
jgi:hypothetical protein